MPASCSTRTSSASSLVRAWYLRGQIDYRQQYMAVYAAYNAWYRSLTQKTNDREALTILRTKNRIWSGYCKGDILHSLRYPMELLVDYTQREPISYLSPHWKGEVLSIYDWPGVIEYWYRVRCLVMHGDEIDARYVYLAYETLNIFMGYIVNCLNDEYCLQHL